MNVSTRPRQVTFFEDRARVERRAQVELDTRGVAILCLEGVSVLIDDPGLVVTVAGGESAPASVRAAQVMRVMHEEPVEERAQIDVLETRSRQAKRALEEAVDAVAQLERDREQLVGLEDALLKHVRSVPAREGQDPTTWSAAFEAIAEKVAPLQERLALARIEVATTDREYRRQELLLRAARVEQPRVVAHVEVQLDVLTPGVIELVLEYFVPCAQWRPSHRARLTRDAAPTIEVVTLATVWQMTGERWEDVPCVFSTARLSKPAAAPLIDDDVLSVRTKSTDERKTIHVEARDQAIVSADIEGGTRTLGELPGIDDGGKPLLFHSERPVTIASDGEPFRVEIGTVTLPATVESVAYPELATTPHLRATATWSAPYPLLAGPLALMREREFAGQSRTDFVAQGDPFHLGFGIDSGVSIARRVDEKTGQSKITGKQWIERAVHVFISNLSGEPRSFDLIERVPVSEVDEVSVTLKGPKSSPDRDGFVRIPIRLEANEVIEESFGYRLEFPAKVVLHI